MGGELRDVQAAPEVGLEQPRDGAHGVLPADHFVVAEVQSLPYALQRATLDTLHALVASHGSHNTASLVFISKELSKGEAGISPGPAQYTIKTTIGPAASKDARNRREPMTVFGTDERDSAERREQKAKSLVGGGHRVVL